jgi:uncharacterized membrane protein
MLRFALRGLFALFAVLLLLQLVALASALWQVQADAFMVSGFLWGALAFKAVLLLLNAALVLLLWRLSGFARRRRLPLQALH